MGKLTRDWGFSGVSGAKFEELSMQAASQCVGDAGTECTLQFDSGWHGFEFRQNEDLVFALHAVEYRVRGTGRATVQADGSVDVSGRYEIAVTKEYNFDPWKAPIEVWGVPYDVIALSQMPAHGLSRDFVVKGTSAGPFAAVLSPR